ncbi:hypothetical protein SGPA1_22026 [Streptomyces misionensis JCM 4497]
MPERGKFHEHYGPHVKRMGAAVGVLALGLGSIEAAMTDMADGHIDNELLVRSMFSKIRVAPHDGDGSTR